MGLGTKLPFDHEMYQAIKSDLSGFFLKEAGIKQSKEHVLIAKSSG